MKIVTFNIGTGWDTCGINAFEHRAGMIWKKIKEEQPDVIAFQEISSPTREFLDDILDRDYYFLGHYRNAAYSDEGLYTAIRRDAWEVLTYETFWISPTPYVAGSRYPNQSECPRICVITLIRSRRTGEIIRLYNIHLDHISEEARVTGMKCVLDQMKKQDEKMPYESILLGDFNAKADTETIAECLAYERHLTDAAASLPGTFHDFGCDSLKIDYIFMTDGLTARVREVGIWDENDHGVFLSDHYPVFVTLED